MMQLTIQQMKDCIYTVRGQQVMLDKDLAKFYETSTKRLNQQVKRNKHCFPSDFTFRLTIAEYSELKAEANLSNPEYGGRRYLPYSFTEHGALMLASVLKTERAVEVNIMIARAFSKSRESFPPQQEVISRLTVLEQQSTQILDLFANIQASFTEQNRPRQTQKLTLTAHQNPTVEMIQQRVTQYYGLTLNDLKKFNRSKSVALPRQIGMYLIRKNTDLSLKEIGLSFGRKDHTTVLHACRQIEANLHQPPVQQALEAIEASLQTQAHTHPASKKTKTGESSVLALGIWER